MAGHQLLAPVPVAPTILRPTSMEPVKDRHRYALDDINDGYRDLEAGRNIRGVVLPHLGRS